MRFRYIPLISLISIIPLISFSRGNDPPSSHPIRFPLRIVKNQGQWPDAIRYMTLPGGSNIIFRNNGIVFLREKGRTRGVDVPLETGTRSKDEQEYEQAVVRFVKPAPRMRLVEGDASETVMHFYVGDSSRWRENAPCTRALRYENVWDGVDLRFETSGNSIRQAMIAKGGARRSAARMVVEGDASLVTEIEELYTGNSPGATTIHRKQGDVSILSDTLVFHLPQRIPNDSVYLWTEFSTYFSGEKGGMLYAYDIRADERGNMVFEGVTEYPDLPVTPNAYQPNSTIDIPGRNWDVSYFGRINCDGVNADYLSYYGIAYSDQFGAAAGADVELGRNGLYMLIPYYRDPNVIAFNSPVGNALEYRYPNDTAFFDNQRSTLCRFDTSGRLVYRSWLSGYMTSRSRIRIGADDGVYITGIAAAGTLPYISIDAFIDTLPSGRYAPPFLLKLTPECDSVVYCTYLPNSTLVHDLAGDANGFVSIVGITQKVGFPVKNAWQPSLRDTVAYGDLFVMRLSPAGDTLAFSTFLGGSMLDSYSGEGTGVETICVTPDGDTFIAEKTRSIDFPLHRPLQSNYRWTNFSIDRTPDLVLTGFRPDGEIMFSSYWGGDGIDVPSTMDLTYCGDILITGHTLSRDFPIVNPPPYADAFSPGTGTESRTFMLLVDPEQVAMHASFLFPGDFNAVDMHYTENGYLHRIGVAYDGFPVFNGFQERALSPAVGAGLSRMYFPLCGEDLLRSRALIQDTIIADSVRGFISHTLFELEVELRNVDATRAAYMVRSSIELPVGLLLQHGETVDKQPDPVLIPPGGVAIVRWRVQLDTAELGGWAGLRDLLLHVGFTHEYKLSTSLASCLTSFSFNDLPLVVKRDDSDNRLVCVVTAADSLRVRADGRGYEPPLLPVSGEVRNTGAGDSPPASAVLRLGRMGPALEPAADSVRAVPVLTPGGAHAVQWTVRPARRADTRRIALQMVVRDERGEITRCAHEIVVPGLRPVQCSLSLPDTILIMKDGSIVPPDILARLRLENVLDTLISDLEARIDLGGVPELGLASGETAGRQWDYVQGGRDVTASWSLRIAKEVRDPVRVDVPVWYRCASDTVWRVCIESVLLYPLHSDLYCGINLPATHAGADVESRNPVTLAYTLTNVGTIPIDIDRLELAIDPANAGLTTPDPMTLSGTRLGPGAVLPWNLLLRAAIWRAARSATCTVTAYGKTALGADSVLSVCDASITIEGVDGLRCAITAPDSVRFERDSLQYEPDPVPVTIDLSNVLDTDETAIETEIDLTGAPRLELSDGEIAMKTLTLIDSHSVARFTWLVSPIADATEDNQDIVIRYRSAEQGNWKECRTTVHIESWPEIAELRCTTGGHDSLFADGAYEIIVPEPFQVSYTATNTGTVTLTGCAAAIVLPEGFALVGSDSVQQFGTLVPGTLAPNESATRWWTVATTDQLQGFGAKDITWVWTSDQQGSGPGCTHVVQVIPDPSSGITLTPLRLYFEAELDGPLPAAQAVKLWTGGGLAMPWTAQSDTWYIDLAPVAGDHAASISVQPNTTMLNKGLHASTITLAGAAPNLPRRIAVDYMITSLTGISEQPAARTLTLGAVYPHPIPLDGEARLLLRTTIEIPVRITLHDLLGRERALLRDDIISETDVLILRPAALGLAPGSYLLRALTPAGMSSRMVTVVR